MRPDNDEAWREGEGPVTVRSHGDAPSHAQTRALQPAGEASGFDDDEPEADFNFLKYWHIAQKWRWLLAAALLAGLAAGVVATLLTTPLYRASTTLQIDREPAKIVAVESQQTPEQVSAAEFYQTQYGLLKSRSLAERIVATLNLAYDDSFLNQKGDKTAAQVARAAAQPRTAAERSERSHQAVSLVMEGLRVEPVQSSRLVKVSYESPNPVVAAKIANAVADNFIATNLERRYEASSYARRFLEGRLAQIRQRLEESERQLVAYAASREIINIGGESTGSDGQTMPQQSLAATDLASMNQALALATNNRIQAEQRWREARSTPDGSLPEVLQNPSSQSLQQQRSTLWAEYQQNLQLFKPDYPTMVEARARIDALDRQLSIQAQSVKGALKNQYDVALRQERSLAAAVEERKGEVLDLRSRSIQYNIIQREVDTNRSLYDGLLQRYKEIGVAGGIGTNNVSVVDRAETPTAPFAPRPIHNLAQFGLAGLMLGVAVAFLLGQLDVSIKVPEDIERALGLPLLGTVPIAPKNLSPVRALSDPKSMLSEAYYSVRTALQFSTQEGVPSSLLVTSSRAAEGKTTTSLAIAAGFARLGMRVLLIDADLRDPSLHKILSRDNGVGLSNLLAGGVDLIPAVQPTHQKNLFFLACGPLP
ncbi:polysaccharide biosynthesis tyrosine autokinase, partial [Phenylobacterium sp.]|uniref:GumC family protein n=1 Tax=Phenylobacterium sp. TaxID=1871053 RepID=UPI00273674FD